MTTGCGSATPTTDASACGKVATDRWADQVLNETLDVPYHHLVFTVPWQFRVLTLRNRKEMLNILFRSAADAILQWCRTYGPYTPGLVAVLPLARRLLGKLRKMCRGSDYSDCRSRAAAVALRANVR